MFPQAKTPLRAVIALLTPLWLTALCLPLLLSAPFLELSYRALGIAENPLSARLIYAHVRARIFSNHQQPLDDRDNPQIPMNYRELAHLDDVSALIRVLHLAAMVTLSTALLASATLKRDSRLVWRSGLRAGAVWTLLLVLALGCLATVAWELIFTAFHQLFFAAGSWQFSSSSTLIRHFPPRYWLFNAAGLALMLSILAGILLFSTRPRPMRI